MNVADDVVPGMAEAIEQRRIEVGLDKVGDFARAVGVTPEGLRPVRQGVRKHYHDKVKFGIARALRWPPDALDRLLAGEDPAGFEAHPAAADSGEGRLDAIEERFDRIESQLAHLAEQMGRLERLLGDD
jgi:hypothetical protein